MRLVIKNKIILALIVLISTGVVFAVTLKMSRGGYGELLISDVTKPVKKSITAPMVPFRNGALFVNVTGEIDGHATLQIISNKGRDRRTEVLSGVIVSKTIGGAEDWVDDLVVRFEPGSAKTGHLRIQMACGTNLKKNK